MESLKYVAAGFLLGFGITYFMQATHEVPEHVDYVDQEMYNDQEIDKVILIEIAQEQ